MIPLRRAIFMEGMKLFDLLLVIGSFLAASFFVAFPEYPRLPKDLFTTQVKLLDATVIASFLLLWHMILSQCCLYVSRRLSSIQNEIIDILKASALGTAVLSFLAIIFRIENFTMAFLAYFGVSIAVMMTSTRVMLRYFLRKFRGNGLDTRSIVIAGSHERATSLAKEIASKPELGYHLIGFVDEADALTQEFEASGYQLVADFDSFPEFVRQQPLDEVMICLPVKSHYQEAARIASICHEHGIIVRFLSDLFEEKKAYRMAQQFEGHSIITFYTGQLTGTGVIVKRTMDVAISLLLTLLASPLFLLTALAIKLSSKGPVFFVQKRLGLNKHYFNVYKFRTMYSDAEKRQAELEHLNEVRGAAFKIRNDPRVTPVGKFLRKSSIDELPQLFNVLNGEMSLVGPRPLPVRDYEGFSQDWHRRRFSVRPGITCLWQISGRHNISFEKWMELDMEYIDNWSLWLDLKILLGTIPAVVKGSGAS